VSDLVFTQEEAQRLKSMLFQVQNAAIDLAKENTALQAKLEAVKRLASIRRNVLQVSGEAEALAACIALGIDPKEL